MAGAIIFILISFLVVFIIGNSRLNNDNEILKDRIVDLNINNKGCKLLNDVLHDEIKVLKIQLELKEVKK
jgi:hypothetical protein